jgi:hypothetical protein
MQDKPLKHNGVRLAQIATGMSPADFPLGSLESRAMARALLDHAEGMKPQLSEYEEDALTIYRFAPHLLDRQGMSPSLSDVEGAVVYQDGNELHERMAAREGSEDPLTLERRREDPFSCVDEMLERRGIEPPPRDAKWREPCLLCVLRLAILASFRAAWERQLGYLPFPLKTEGEGWDRRLYVRSASGEWREETDEYKRRSILGPEKELRELLRAESGSTA